MRVSQQDLQLHADLLHYFMFRWFLTADSLQIAFLRMRRGLCRDVLNVPPRFRFLPNGETDSLRQLGPIGDSFLYVDQPLNHRVPIRFRSNCCLVVEHMPAANGSFICDTFSDSVDKRFDP